MEFRLKGEVPAEKHNIFIFIGLRCDKDSLPSDEKFKKKKKIRGYALSYLLWYMVILQFQAHILCLLCYEKATRFIRCSLLCLLLKTS